MSLKKVSFGRSLYCKKKVRPANSPLEVLMLQKDAEVEG